MQINNFPKKIPVFPLSNFIIFPKTTVPLNIFEPRYIDMINDSMKSDKLIGMIQPLGLNNIGQTDPNLHQVGCLGKIISFNETDDRRFIISLSGIIRFRIKKEVEKEKLYRNFEVDYSDFLNDLEIKKDNMVNINKIKLLKKIKIFFQKISYPIDYNELEKLNLDQLVSTVSMISPFSVEEKQKLIETVIIDNKIKILDEILNFNLLDYQENKTIQ